MSGRGNYTGDLFRENQRYAAALMQRSEVGRPSYIFDDDMRDWARMQQIALQRLTATIHPTPAFADDSWKVVPETVAGFENNNFRLLGRQAEAGADSNLAHAWGWGFVGGLRAVLHKSTDFNCMADTGAFDLGRADAVHHRWTSVGAGYVEDSRMRWASGYFNGRGLICRLWDGDYVITSNTKTRLYLQDFDAVDLPLEQGDRFYHVKLASPGDVVAARIFLDVHLEDFGMAQDPKLNHNAGSPLEGCRRLKVVQQVRVEYDDGTDTFAAPIANYRDYGGIEHWVAELASFEWEGEGDPAPIPDPTNERDDEAGVGPEVSDARVFGGCVPEAQQPQHLVDRLERERGWVTVGPEENPGVYWGEVGLRAALACATVHGIYLKAGTITLTSALSIPADMELHFEGGAILDADTYGVVVNARAKLRHGTIQGHRADGAVLTLQGADINLVHITVEDDLPGTGVAYPLVYGPAGVAGLHLERCNIVAGARKAFEIKPTASVTPGVGMGGRVGISLQGCYVRSEAELAVKILGFSISIANSTIVGRLGAVFVDGEGHAATQGSRPTIADGVSLHDNVLVGLCGADGTTLPYVLRARNATLLGSGNQVELAYATADITPVLPPATVLIDTVNGKTGEILWEGNLVRAGWVGILYLGADAARARLAANTVVPFNDSSAIGIEVISTNPVQAVEVCDNLVMARAPYIPVNVGEPTIGIQVSGFARVFRNTIDFAGYGIDLLGGTTRQQVVGENLITSCLTGIRVATPVVQAALKGNACHACTIGVHVLVGVGVVDVDGLICRDIVTNGVKVDRALEGGNGVTVRGADLHGSATATYGLIGVDLLQQSKFNGIFIAPILLTSDMRVEATRFAGVATALAEAGSVPPPRLTFWDCDSNATLQSAVSLERVVARRSTFRSVGAAALHAPNNFGTGLLDLEDCTFYLDGAAAVTSTNARVKMKGCWLGREDGGDYTHRAADLRGGVLPIQVDDCEFDGGNSSMLYVVADDADVRRCRFTSRRSQNLPSTFAPEDRALYVELSAKGTAARIHVDACTLIGSGLSAYGGDIDTKILVTGCTFQKGTGIWGRGRVLIDNNLIEIAGTLLIAPPNVIDTSPIYLGDANPESEDDDNESRANEIEAAVRANPIISNHKIPWAGAQGIDWEADATHGRSAAIVITSATNPVVERNNIGVGNESQSDTPDPWTAILLGYIGQVTQPEPGWRVGVHGAIVRDNQMGSSKLVAVMSIGGSCVALNNVWHLVEDVSGPLDAIYAYHTSATLSASTAVLRVRGNSVVSKYNTIGYDTERGHNPNYWGLIRVSRLRSLDNADAVGGNVTVEPRRMRQYANSDSHQDITGLDNDDPQGAVGRVDIIRLLNDLAIGDDLDPVA